MTALLEKSLLARCRGRDFFLSSAGDDALCEGGEKNHTGGKQLVIEFLRPLPMRFPNTRGKEEDVCASLQFGVCGLSTQGGSDRELCRQRDLTLHTITTGALLVTLWIFPCELNALSHHETDLALV